MSEKKSCECAVCCADEHKHSHGHCEHNGTHDCEEQCCSCCEKKLSGEREDGEVRNALIKIILAGGLFAASFFVPNAIIKTVMLYIAYFTVGAEVIIGAVKELVNGFSIDEEFLMTVATVGAMAIGEMTEAVAVMLFYSVGELLEDIACERSRRSITALLALRPDKVTLKKEDGSLSVDLEDIAAGDIVIVSAGERIAVDGVIIKGETEVDNSALTGESLPVYKKPGDGVFGGGINLSGTVEIRVDKPYAESSAARILKLVEEAQDKKSKAERFISRFAKKYTVAVVLLALIIAFVCPVFTGYQATFVGWFYRGLTLLVVSCPCAFVISVPLCFFAGIGCASRNGILVKGAASIEQLSKLSAVAFDKTGTLTKGELKAIKTEGGDDVLMLAAHAELRSTHPIAKAIIRAYGRVPDEGAVTDITEQAGMGVSAKVYGDEIFVGRADSESGAAVSVRKNGAEIGKIYFSDELKPDSRETISALKELKVSDAVILSGDSEGAARQVGNDCGITDIRAKLTPEEKCKELEKIKESGKVTAFVGDGINDAPVLAMADIGVAMGGLGADAAIETADVVILDDRLYRLPLAVKISRRTMQIAYECVALAFLAKFAVIVLEIFGLAGMWAAVFADVGVTIFAILNALRALRYRAK